jgi:putative Holliday junction resolvase
VALSDPEGILASPLTIIDRQDDQRDMETINDYVKRHQVRQIIVGLPRSMDGSLGEQAAKVKSFTQKLYRHTEARVEFRDERLTTVAAKRLRRAAGIRKTKKGHRDDAMAAAIILQGYLDEGVPSTHKKLP